MEMLVSSLDEIHSDELVIVRIACSCGIRNEIVVLCDPTDRRNREMSCPICKRIFTIDMEPVFIVGVGDWDWESKDVTVKSMKDEEILKEIKKIDSKFKVV